jgi:lambda family phage portal protein
MSNPVAILDPSGNPLPPSRLRQRARALSGGSGNYGGPPYDAADLYGQHMAAWTPALWSPDAETNIYRDRIVSRVRDMVRNDGWASGAVTRILDNTVGGNLRPIAKPDYRFLATVTGNKAFDNEWAKEFARAIDANWRSWVHDPGLYCDAGRRLSFGQQMRVGFRHKLVDGDALAVMKWLPKRVGYGRARYATAVQLVDPDRLSNPQLRFDQQSMRGGVEIDGDGAAVAYHIRKAHQGDWWAAADSLTWERVPRETPWGRPVVVHDFDSDRSGQHRGGVGIFAPVLQRLKMLVKYDGVELDASIINAIFAAYVESPFDRELVGEALSDNEALAPQINAYQGARSEFYNSNKIMLGDARIPIMFPGEKINTVASTRPNNNFEAFESAVLRNVASGVGLAAHQITNNYADINYSAAKAALVEIWKTLSRRRQEFGDHFAQPIRISWLEEAFEVDDLPLPKGAPEFIEFRGAYARCRWLGPGMGWLDPVDERTGAVIGLDAGFDTLEDICAAQGLDWEENLEQRAYEVKKFKELGLPLPEWAGQVAVNRVTQRPEAK